MFVDMHPVSATWPKVSKHRDQGKDGTSEHHTLQKRAAFQNHLSEAKMALR